MMKSNHYRSPRYSVISKTQHLTKTKLNKNYLKTPKTRIVFQIQNNLNIEIID